MTHCTKGQLRAAGRTALGRNFGMPVAHSATLVLGRVRLVAVLNPGQAACLMLSPCSESRDPHTTSPSEALMWSLYIPTVSYLCAGMIRTRRAGESNLFYCIFADERKSDIEMHWSLRQCTHNHFLPVGKYLACSALYRSASFRAISALCSCSALFAASIAAVLSLCAFRVAFILAEGSYIGSIVVTRLILSAVMFPLPLTIVPSLSSVRLHERTGKNRIRELYLRQAVDGIC